MRLFCVLGLMAYTTVEVRAEEPKPPTRFEIPAIDAYLNKQLKAKGFVGLSVAVAQNGKITLARGYGKSGLDGPDVTPDIAFAIGSVTKQFACACILLLAEDGKLSVHDKVAKYYPDLTRAKDISLYDLMSHTSGYPDYYPLDFVDRRMAKSIPLDDLLKQYAGGKLDFEPGTRWSYSNTGYILLGRVVEKVSGMSFGEFLTKRILKPLDMDHSYFEPAVDDKRIAKGYTAFFLSSAESAPPEASGWLHAAGGLYCTATDLVKWDLGLMGGKVLKPESLKFMTTPRILADGRKKGYGCGLSIGEVDDETVWRHGGAISGFHAANLLVPRTKSAVVVLANAEHLDSDFLARELLTLVLKRTADTPAIPVIKGLPAADAAKAFLKQMQDGKLDREQLAEEFRLFMDEKRVKDAAPRLKALGDPIKVEIVSRGERGGFEVARVRFTFPGEKKAVAMMYRSTDGKMQQFLLYKD